MITGGLRVSSDFAKALAMGADAVAIASAALMAAACQQYRICGTGMCPVGVATQDPQLRKRFPQEAAARRVANYLNVTLEELKTLSLIHISITVTIPGLTAARSMFCSVPAATKAEAVRDMLNGQVSERCPASILTTHPDAALYLDRDSASGLL